MARVTGRIGSMVGTIEASFLDAQPVCVYACAVVRPSCLVILITYRRRLVLGCLCGWSQAAILWLSKYQHELQPRGGKFLLENFGEKVRQAGGGHWPRHHHTI